MGMSQEEIEKLMSGIYEDEESEDLTDDPFIKSLMEGNFNNDKIITETKKPVTNKKDEPIKKIIKKEIKNDDSIVKKEELPKPSEKENKTLNDLTNIINDIEKENKTLNDLTNIINDIEKENKKDVLINLDSVKKELEEEKIKSNNINESITEKISKGVFPLPDESQTKVVNQLSEVANDSEEKVSLIFDSLSNINDENNKLIELNKKNMNFLNKQERTFVALKTKFPNIKTFDDAIKDIIEQKKNNEEILKTLTEENNKIFMAMELMQFNDINRQKIERVMSVIRKLSNYLNNIFEDNSPNKEIVTAKYIQGDNKNDIVNDDDIEKLIKEYNL